MIKKTEEIINDYRLSEKRQYRVHKSNPMEAILKQVKRIAYPLSHIMYHNE